MNTLILAGALGVPKEAMDTLRAWAEDEPAPALSAEQLRAAFLHQDRYFYARKAPPIPWSWTPTTPDDLPPGRRNGHTHG